LPDSGGATPAATVTRRIELLRYLAAEDGARFARWLEGAPSDPCVAGPIADAVRRLVNEKVVRAEATAAGPAWQVIPDRRPLVDFHRNAIVHRYVALAIVAAAVRSRRAPEDAWGAFQRASWISRLLKLEFTYQPGTSAEEAFQALVALLDRLGAVARASGTLVPGAAPELLDFLAAQLRPFLEGYRLTFETALHLLDPATLRRPLTRRRLVAASLERGRLELASGRMRSNEAVSKATTENAAEWLILGHFLREGADGELFAPDGAQTLRAVVDRINPLLAP
ncbi:MAG: glycerol-3-phosphate acyltransferase, partial [Anaeromyxobacteraceae bacterium]